MNLTISLLWMALILAILFSVIFPVSVVSASASDNTSVKGEQQRWTAVVHLKEGTALLSSLSCPWPTTKLESLQKAAPDHGTKTEWGIVQLFPKMRHLFHGRTTIDVCHKLNQEDKALYLLDEDDDLIRIPLKFIQPLKDLT